MCSKNWSENTFSVSAFVPKKAEDIFEKPLVHNYEPQISFLSFKAFIPF